jgi:uncharacterized protein (TIGR02452 family)
MKRNTRADKAQETLKIIEDGYYNVDQKQVVLRDSIKQSVDGSRLIRAQEFGSVLKDADDKLATLHFQTIISIENTTVLKAAQHLALQGGTVGCLNFASAKNPGGGFLGGAQAQEESLALSSALYPTLLKHIEMYEYNRGRSTFLYSDYMIYSPNVMVFRNDDGDVLEAPYQISFVTSPAVNIGAMKTNRPQELELAEKTMMQRMDKVLALFVHQNTEHLLLGAWGCGVFQNRASNVAKYFVHYLLNDGKYSKAFKTVTFAVLDRSKDGQNIKTFNDAFACT